MASASSCDRLDSVLRNLRRWSHQNRHGKGYNPEPIIYGLVNWRFLMAFLNHIQSCSDADKIVKNFQFLVMKIQAVSNNMADDLSVVSSSSSFFYISIAASSGVLGDLRKWERTIGLYKKQVGEVLEEMSSGSCFEFHPPLLHYSLWLNFFESIQTIVSYIGTQVHDRGQREEIDAFGKRLVKLYGQVEGLEFGSASDPDIDKFFTQIAFSAFRIAKQALYYWLNSDNSNSKGEEKMAESTRIIRGLLDLENEVDPTTPGFLELNLKFIRALSKIVPNHPVHSATCFLRYICGNSTLYDLQSLVMFVINVAEISSEHVQCFLVEVKAVLIEAGCLFRDKKKPHDLSLELHTRICLLKVEVFLKQHHMSSSISFLEDQIKNLKECWNEVRSFSSNLTPKKIEFLDALVDQVTKDAPLLYASFQAKKITRERVRISLFILLLKIVLFKAELFCIDLQNDTTPCLVALGRERIKSLLEGLNSFTSFIESQHLQQHNMESTEDVELIFTNIEAVSRRLISLCYSFLVNEITGKMIGEMTASFSYLLDKMALFEAEFIGLTLPPRSNFPMTNGMTFIDFLLGNLGELLKRDPASIALVKHHIEDIRLDLQFLRQTLHHATENPELKGLSTQVVEVAYEVEYAVDSIEVEIGAHWQHLVWLYHTLREIRLVKTEASKISREMTCNVRSRNVTQISSHMISRDRAWKIHEVVVRLSDQEEAVIDQLTRGSSQRNIVSIVGMAGIGKTTLARRVYNDPNVKCYFHVRAWCSVSQAYGKRELLLEILSHFSGLSDSIHDMNDEDLELMLYRHLKGQRHLIVMDDVWNSRVWIDLGSSFPDDGNGSRILITSRLYDLDLEAKPPFCLRLFSDAESWELLRMKIFHGCCPDELLEVGKEIAKNCQGLPLAIVAIAGLLRGAEKTQVCWKKFAESFASQIYDDPQMQCMEILQLSYNDLPEYLKACFLYFGAFMGDKDIPVCKLIRLWIAEGLIGKVEPKSLEDLAEDYLMDLIHRSLVIVSKVGSKGQVKACRIHDMLRNLCLSKANEEKFLQLINRHDEPYSSFDDLDHGADFYDYNPSIPVRYDRHRLSIYLKRKHFVKSNPSGPCTRSLVFFATSDTYPRRPYDISFIPNNFKLLRVLDLENINMGMFFPAGIELLIQLRYLAVSGDIESIPPSISKLWKLETFVVKGLKGKVIMPATIWCMARLRHVHVSNHVEFDLHDYDLETSSQLDNLMTFSSPSFSHGKDSEKIIKMLPNLLKLRCIFTESWDSSRRCNRFPALDFLTHLQSLNIFYYGKALDPDKFSLPVNLKKLTLSNFRLPWNSIAAIGKLPNLEILKLLRRAFEGLTWDMREGEFQRLKFLKLDTLNIAQWNASENPLPYLEQLVIRQCKDLKEVPYAFGEILTLKVIEVQSCRQSTEESVRNIAEDEIEGLKIIINDKILM